MKILRNAKRLNAAPRPVCVAIGIFDGVHLGHQQIIRQTIDDARLHDGVSLVITFDCHPNTIVAPNRVPPLIQNLSSRIRSIAAQDVNALLLFHFDRAFSEQPGEAFIRNLAADLGTLKSICVGADFVFGHNRSGDLSLLRKLGKELRFSVHGMAAVALDGETVSSTRIRKAIRDGDFDGASQMLGRAYALCGRVIRGDELGRRLGYPTANIDITGLVSPPNGVYAVQATAGRRTCHGVMNIGFRPTLRESGPHLHAEVHLLDYNADLYDKDLEVTFVARLRPERAFRNLDELKSQIRRDIEEARTRF